VCRALADVEAVLGALHVRRGHVEDMGLHDVELYGVPADKMPDVRAFLQRQYPMPHVPPYQRSGHRTPG